MYELPHPRILPPKPGSPSVSPGYFPWPCCVMRWKRGTYVKHCRQPGRNTLLNRLQEMSAGGQDLKIATAFFSLDALLLLADTICEYGTVRLLFGDDANALQRRRLLQMLRERSDADLLAQRETLPTLAPLKKIAALFAEGRVEARCYTSKKFHAKAYHVNKASNYPPQLGVIGSGNFTRPGLCQNIELNVQLTQEQTVHLDTWFDARWAEAAADVVTGDVLAEIRRQIDLYEPYVLYLKALYAWGAQEQGDGAGYERTKLLNALDPHQEQGFQRALQILKREHGVMVCDGVGLGKSFVALALMEHFCREGQNVLLVAPKSILSSSWNGYLETYLSRYRQPYGSIYEIAMTELGFDPEGDGDTSPAALQEKRELVNRLFERAGVIVVDESHNFRTTNADRYKNMARITSQYHQHRKKVVMLSATPINTAYRDMSSQLALITHEKGTLGGYSSEQIKRYASQLDKEEPVAASGGQLSMSLLDTPSQALNRVLESVIIQRSRATCKKLAEAEGKVVRFPKRTGPHCLQVVLGVGNDNYRALIKLAEERFKPGVELVRQMRAEVEKADRKGTNILPVSLKKGQPKGIKLAAFLTEQYRLVPTEGKKVYLDEVHLAGLVFSNTLKQLESSPVAFQSIMQSLGMGLLARLQHVYGEDAGAVVAEHEGWIRTLLFAKPEVETVPDTDTEEDGDTLDAGGEETDAWLVQAVKARQLGKKLRDFTPDVFDVERWRADIVADLGFLKEVHAATLRAREQPDPKMACVLPTLRELVANGRRVLIFTQSQRTAEYLERELRERLTDSATVARIDSRVEKTRAAILHSPSAPAITRSRTAPSVPEHNVDILISTDVLSEGVNLQEAGAIMSFDIHWNPVRLIQRIGRVDRRLNPVITPDDHSFDILNVLPPDEINDIINLVGTVENRTLKISKALGLDVSFFKSTDPAGTLKEFNAQYEGEVAPRDLALTEYVKLSVEPPDKRTQAILDATPPGAFGVWKNAPQDGLFALFTMEAKKEASEADRERFAALLGRPVLILEQPGHPPLTDAGQILALLSGTVPDAPSGTPSDEAALSKRLAKLKESVRRQFGEIGLPNTILPKLSCWMELKKGTA